MNLIAKAKLSLQRAIKRHTHIFKPSRDRLNPSLDALLERLGQVPRLALVKQSVFPDLYTVRTDSVKDLIGSSLMRSGPVGLFTKLGADFLIVGEAPEPECQIWREKMALLDQPESFFRRPRRFGADAETEPVDQSAAAVSVDDVDWSAYDIVIALECAVPERVVSAHRDVLWAYMMGEPGIPSGKRSRVEPLAGYDVYLNQRFRRRPRVAGHVVEFPYHLHYWPCFHEMLGVSASAPSQGIVFERYTAGRLSESNRARYEKLMPVGEARGSAEQVIRTLVEASYYLSVDPPRWLWGNGFIEAIAAGCVCLANQKRATEWSILPSESWVNSHDEAIDKIQSLEADPTSKQALLDHQRAAVNTLCFERPLVELIQRWQSKVSAT